MEIRQRVREVVVDDGWALVRVEGVPDRPGIAAQVFGKVAAAGIPVDLILQNASVERSTDLSFTVRSEHAERVLGLLREVQAQIGAHGVEALDRLAMIQLVGTGILSDPSSIGRLFRVLADANVNILAIGTSEVRITCLVKSEARERARKALHQAFQPDQPLPAGARS